MNPVTVTQLSNYIKSLIDGDVHLNSLVVCGEISNFKDHSSGHLYFSLKDDGAVINAVMFKGYADKLRFRSQNGMKVIVFGKVSSYPKSGQYQIYVSDMQPDGVGALYLAFEELKRKLYAQGIFAQERKKPLPQYPKCIALVTSPTGAAVRDMIRILRSRFPMTRVVVCPVKVQGEGAAQSIADMLDYINRFDFADLIICGRGGGSAEDLWAFNEEVLANAVFRSRIPVISAVGHEPDVTISDYVADKRAATPSNAAEIAVPDATELCAFLASAFARLTQAENMLTDRRRHQLSQLAASRVFSSPWQYYSDRRMEIAFLGQNMEKAMVNIIAQKKNRFVRATATLDAISPLKLIGRGYSLVSAKGKIISSVSAVETGENISVRLSDGSLGCTVNEKSEVL